MVLCSKHSDFCTEHLCMSCSGFWPHLLLPEITVRANIFKIMVKDCYECKLLQLAYTVFRIIVKPSECTICI
jgi:hypothetical protein